MKTYVVSYNPIHPETREIFPRVLTRTTEANSSLDAIMGVFNGASQRVIDNIHIISVEEK